MSFLLRPAALEDANAVAQLVNLAAEGMPKAFWMDQSNVGQDPMELGAIRCAQKDTATSFHRSTLAELDGEIVGMMLSYDLCDAPDDGDGSVHPIFRPMMRFVKSVGSSGSINVMAVYPKYQRRGIGSALLNNLESSDRGKTGQQALLMTDVNSAGRAFSEGRHYKIVDKAPVIKGTWETPAASWHLRRKLHS